MSPKEARSGLLGPQRGTPETVMAKPALNREVVERVARLYDLGYEAQVFCDQFRQSFWCAPLVGAAGPPPPDH